MANVLEFDKIIGHDIIKNRTLASAKKTDDYTYFEVSTQFCIHCSVLSIQDRGDHHWLDKWASSSISPLSIFFFSSMSKLEKVGEGGANWSIIQEAGKSTDKALALLSIKSLRDRDNSLLFMEKDFYREGTLEIQTLLVPLWNDSLTCLRLPSDSSTCVKASTKNEERIYTSLLISPRETPAMPLKQL